MRTEVELLKLLRKRYAERPSFLCTIAADLFVEDEISSAEHAKLMKAIRENMPEPGNSYSGFTKSKYWLGMTSWWTSESRMEGSVYVRPRYKFIKALIEDYSSYART